MSLFGAMNTAVSGLSAQSNAFGNISDNVANSQTVGYKRVDTSFIDYLTSSSAANNVPGSVVTRPDYVNNVEGTITQTDNTLGLAITGQGFFAVSKQAGTANNLPTFEAQQEYTRAGDFQMDKNGYLKNSAGLFLNGWVVTNGVANQNSLLPIQVSQTVFNPIATDDVALSANLPATPALGAATPAILYAQPDVDINIGQQTYNAINAATTATPSAKTLAVQGLVTKLNNDIKIALAAPTAANATTVSTDVTNALAKLNTDGTTANPAWVPVTAAPATVTLGNVKTPAATPAAPISSDISVYDALGNSHTVTLNWVQNAPNAWTVNIATDGGAPLGSTNVTFGTGALNDTAAGTVNGVDLPNPAPAGFTVSAPYNSANQIAQPAWLQFTANFGGTAQPIKINLGTYGKPDGITQYAGTDYNLRGLTQNGVPPGAFSSVSTATNGDIAVNYDNGQTRVIARVPVITFNNPNGLQRQDGQSFTVSQDSGGPLAETANTNGAGGLITQSVEGSNVDIASEFTKLIVAQRAYSANTKIVTTSDDMLQQTIDMKR